MHGSSKRLVWLFTAILAITLGSIVTAWVLGLRVTAVNTQVMRIRDLIDDLRETVATLVNAETGQRGFLLSHNERYLEPYESAAARIRDLLGRLDQWAADGEIPPDSTAAVARIAQEKLDELKLTIELARQKTWPDAIATLRTGIAKRIAQSIGDQATLPAEKGPQAAIAVVDSGVGKQIMDDLRQRLTNLESAQRQQLVAHRRRRDQATDLRTFISATLALLNFFFLGWALHRIAKQIRGIQAARAELQRQKDLLSVTLSSIGDGVIVTDARGNVTFLNPEAERLTGWTTQDAAGQPLPAVFKIINEQTRQSVENPVEKVLRIGAAVGLANHTVLVAKDGRETPIDDSGTPSAIATAPSKASSSSSAISPSTRPPRNCSVKANRASG